MIILVFMTIAIIVILFEIIDLLIDIKFLLKKLNNIFDIKAK